MRPYQLYEKCSMIRRHIQKTARANWAWNLKAYLLTEYLDWSQCIVCAIVAPHSDYNTKHWFSTHSHIGRLRLSYASNSSKADTNRTSKDITCSRDHYLQKHINNVKLQGRYPRQSCFGEDSLEYLTSLAVTYRSLLHNKLIKHYMTQPFKYSLIILF